MRAALPLVAVALAAGAGLVARAGEDPGPPIARIVEVVRAPALEPVEGAVVEAWGAGKGPIVRRTGADGTVRFDVVPRKGVVFVARLPGYRCGWHEPGRWWWVQPEEDRDPDADGVTRMRLVLVPGTVVEGRVLTRAGTPIEGAVVEAREDEHARDVWALRGAPLWTATTDAEGRFRTDEHWPRPQRKGDKHVSAIVTAGGEGWIHEQVEIRPGDAGKQRPLAFRLLPAGEIRGVVRLPDGEPAPGAIVHAYPPDFWAFAPGRRTRRNTARTHPREMHVRANAEGAYVLPEAHPGVAYRLFAEVEDDGEVVARSEVTDGVGVRAPRQSIVRDLRARRLGSLRVVLPAYAGGSAKRRHVEFVPPPRARPWVHAREGDGAVTVEHADPGEWTIEVDAAGRLSRREVVTLAEGEAKTVEIRLERGVVVAGRVVDDAGDPVPEATVYAYSVDPENPDRHLDGYEQTTTDAAGRFRLGGLRPGPTDLMLDHESLQSEETVRVEAPSSDAVLVLHASASLRIRLRLPPGAALPRTIRVTITRLDGPNVGTQRQESVSRRDDVYVVHDLMPGAVACAVEAKGFAPCVARLTIRPGVANEADPFVLAEGIVLRGRVVDGKGRGVPGARVLAWGNEDHAARTGTDGAFAIPYLAEGPVDLAVEAAGMAMALLSPRVTADAKPLTIRVSPGGLVRGTLRDAAGGDPLISIDFFPAAAPDDNVSRWRADVRDGTFTIRLPAGTYRCAPRRASALRGPTVFEVEEDGETVLDLVWP